MHHPFCQQILHNKILSYLLDMLQSQQELRAELFTDSQEHKEMQIQFV